LFALSRKHLIGQRPEQVFSDAAGLVAAIDKALESGAAYTEQELELRVNGKPKLHLTCTASPIDGGDAALLLEFRHIDQQLKIAREERLNEQQQANRELVRNLAHEIKNPLGGIRGAAQLLERELERPQLIEYTQVVIGEADRLQSLVNRLLTPHRLPSFRRTNIHEILVRVKGVVQAEFPLVALACDFDISLPEFDADPEQLTQAVLNIVRNAAQALAVATADPCIRLTTRVARYVTLARKPIGSPSPWHRGQRPGHSRGDPGAHLLSAGVGARRRHRARAHARAGVRRAARRHDRVREHARAHGVHDRAAAWARSVRRLAMTTIAATAGDAMLRGGRR
jgi:two-component system nitrogen regulation sensor histidine kinase GlnL